MITGDTAVKLLILESDSGVAQSYADKAAFQAAGWDLSWQDTAAVALSPQPTWTIADQGNGLHLVAYAVPAGITWAEVTIPAGYIASASAWADEGQSYDADSIAGILNLNQGIPAVSSASDGDLGDVVDGDSWNSGVLTVPIGKLTRVGLSDLSTFDTITATLKQDPSNTPVEIDADFDDVSARTVHASWDTFPSDMELGDDARALSAIWYLDITLTQNSPLLVITPLRYKLTVRWNRTATPGP